MIDRSFAMDSKIANENEKSGFYVSFRSQALSREGSEWLANQQNRAGTVMALVEIAAHSDCLVDLLKDSNLSKVIRTTKLVITPEGTYTPSRLNYDKLATKIVEKLSIPIEKPIKDIENVTSNRKDTANRDKKNNNEADKNSKKAHKNFLENEKDVRIKKDYNDSMNFDFDSVPEIPNTSKRNKNKPNRKIQ